MTTRPLIGLLACLAILSPSGAHAQDIAIGDLVMMEQDVPFRLVGYGLVVGLDGTGDRALGGSGGGQTVRSVANLLRRFGLVVPPDALRPRNVAAVLVTGEVSPYLRPGGRFEVQVASVGDAVSLRGGVLWPTPLVSNLGESPVATAQGSVLISDGFEASGLDFPIETSARLSQAGLLEAQLPITPFASTSRLLLADPDLSTALRIAGAINQELGDDMAAVEDPGSVVLSLSDEDGPGRAAIISQIEELRIQPNRRAQLIIDGRDGTVVAGGDMRIGEAVVSHGGMTLSVGTPEGVAGTGIQVRPGATVQEVAQALHQLGAPPNAIATIFKALNEIGALPAKVSIR